MDMGTRNQLTRIDGMFQENLQLISELNEKILNDCEDAEFFKMLLRDATANLPILRTSVLKMFSPQEN